MNFPESQRTGRLGELSVEVIFTEWGWTVGQDKIDVGYDHFVEPARSKYRGARFLVQTKATSTSDGSNAGRIVATVSKDRLREYASNPIPVFIVRVSKDRRCYWIHAQSWCRQNLKRLRGSGESRLVIPSTNCLDNRDQFESFLQDIFQPLEEQISGISQTVRAREEYLSKLDPKLSVKISAAGTSQTYFISPTTNGTVVQAKFGFCSPGPQADQASPDKQLRDHMDFGLPAELSVENLVMTGSPIFAEIGLASPTAGRVSISPVKTESATITLTSGRKYDFRRTAVALKAVVTRGEKGVALSTIEKTDFHALLLIEKDVTPAESKIHFSHGDMICSSPIRTLPRLEIIGNWAREVIEHNSMHLFIDTGGKRITATTTFEDASSMGDFFHRSALLGRIYSLATYSECDYVFSPSHIEKDDWWSIEAAYRVLKGERVAIPVTGFTYKPNEGVELENLGQIALVTSFEITLGGYLLASIPVRIGFVNFELNKNADGSMSFVRKDESRAYMMYREDEEIDAGLFSGLFND